MNVTLWDDAAQAKMNTEPKQIQVIKVFESRISKNRDQQLTGLAEEAARRAAFRADQVRLRALVVGLSELFWKYRRDARFI